MVHITDRVLRCSDPDRAIARAIENLEGDASFRYVGTPSSGGFPYTVPGHGDSPRRGECRIKSRAETYVRADRGVISHQHIRRLDRRFDHTAPLEQFDESVLDEGVQVRIKHRSSRDPRVGLKFGEISRFLALDPNFLRFKLPNERQQKDQQSATCCDPGERAPWPGRSAQSRISGHVQFQLRSSDQFGLRFHPEWNERKQRLRECSLRIDAIFHIRAKLSGHTDIHQLDKWLSASRPAIVDASTFTSCRGASWYFRAERGFARFQRGEMKVSLCRFCQPHELRQLAGEMSIHFPGREDIMTPTVWAFPPLTICLHYGCADFMVHGDPLQELRDLTATLGASEVRFGGPLESQG